MALISINKKLYSFRRSRGLDRHEFAEAIEKDYLTVTKWENGALSPTDEELAAIAEKFEVSPEVFGIDPKALPPKKASVEDKPEVKAEEKPEPKLEVKVEEKSVPVVNIEIKPELICEPEVKDEPKEDAPCDKDAQTPAEEESDCDAVEVTEYKEISAPAVSGKEEKAYEEKKERYEKHVRLSSYRNFGVKVRRALALFFDCLIHGIFFGALCIGALFLYATFGKADAELFEIVADLALMFIAIFGVALPLSLILRDLIFGGRSLGKRIFRLMVVDERTGKKCVVWQRLFRNIFATELLDVILVLVRGKTIGDSVVGTLVVSKPQFLAPVVPEVDEVGEPIYDVPERGRKNRSFAIWVLVLAVIAAVALVFAVAFTVVSPLFDELKQSDGYEMALDCVVNSEAFAEAELDESELSLVFISFSVNPGEARVTYYFAAEENVFSISLYKVDDGEWTVYRKVVALDY